MQRERERQTERQTQRQRRKEINKGSKCHFCRDPST